METKMILMTAPMTVELLCVETVFVRGGKSVMMEIRTTLMNAQVIADSLFAVMAFAKDKSSVMMATS
jgi:fumarate reductase subunit C